MLSVNPQPIEVSDLATELDRNGDILCDCTRGIENAKHVHVVDIFEVGVGEIYSWFNDSYASILNGQRIYASYYSGKIGVQQ